ncbi:hypothetical protein Angca_001434, partial [Angiostrongylus cantonensis]
MSYIRLYGTETKTTRGTEHAKAMRKFGGGNANWSLYKAKEMSRYSFCDAEIAMAKHRL